MATKIKDGLFIGDAEASQDPEFIELNKITFVINCAGRELPNLWEQHGLHYLTFPWTSDPDCTLFDGGNVVIEQITSFIDEAAGKGDSVLLHSVNGTGRCIACVAAYLMFRHRWSFEKALDFLCNKRPDAAPNPGFVQQLYRLDMRLCERWYGQNKEPAEDARLRHDQWIPLVPGVIPGRGEPREKCTQGLTSAAGQHPEPNHNPHHYPSSSFDAAIEGKTEIVDVIAEAAAGRFGGAASAFPSLGRLTEVQEEEIVLVNSFLNSQPQIDALPPGRADYEDHISKELHWIDRPRIDKLTAAGRLGRTNDRRQQHMIPVSPRTGRAVPERPGNSSYNALSRGNKTATKASAPVGILKKMREKTERSASGVRAQTKAGPASPAAGSTAHALGTTLSDGSAVTSVSVTRGKGGTRLAPSSLPSSLRHPAGATIVEDEVVVEDLSEPQSGRWSGGDCEHEAAGGGETSSAGLAQGGGLSPEDDTEASSSVEGERAPRLKSTAGCFTGTHDHTRHRSTQPSATVAKSGYGMNVQQAPSPSGGVLNPSERASPFDSSVGQAGDPAPPARHGERQAWDGNNSAGPSSAATKAADSYGRGVVGASRLEIDEQREKSQTGSSRTTSDNPPHTGERSANTRRRGHFKDRENAAAAVSGESEAVAAMASPKQLRRGGSEGSLHKSLTFLSTKAMNPSENKTRLPQAPVRRATNQDQIPPDDYPGPGWGPDDVRRDGVGLNKKQAAAEIVPPTRQEEHGKGQETWGRKASEDSGGSLQQLARTPNPQQRRLPSPRPQQGLGQQGDRRQGSSDKGSLFPQTRPSSAPSQRPDAPDSDSNSCSTNAAEDGRNGSSGASGNGSIAHSLPSSETTGGPRFPASSSVGTRNQGYPAHGLMPSGSTVQMNAGASDRSGRWRAPTSSANESGSIGIRPRSSSQAQEASVGGSGGGQREATTSFLNAGGGEGGEGGRVGGAYVSIEHGHVARTSSGEDVGAEQHRSGADRGSSAASLPREISTPTSTAVSPVVHYSRARGTGSPAPPPTSDRSVGAGSSGGDHLRLHGSRRGFDSSASNAPNTSKSKATGILRPTAGTLPLPSRNRGSYSRGGDVGDGGGRESSADAVRWANPTPRGRHGHGDISSGTYGSPGSKENRGGGSGGASTRTSKAVGYAYGQVPFDHRIQQTPSGRAGGAPIYRAGSPAPTRGRRSAANSTAAATTAPDPSRFLQQQRSRGPDRKRYPSGVPPGFRGYIASSGSSGAGSGVGDNSRRGMTTRRGHAPSPTARDRGSRASGSDEASSATAPCASSITDRSSGQRPSTSEGLAGGSGAGRRGRSASPALRPSSASGRRRSASPSPASLFTSKIDPSFDRPRWK
ncbi:unnamed protein product [Hapterophycus canaliculatus]